MSTTRFELLEVPVNTDELGRIRAVAAAQYLTPEIWSRRVLRAEAEKQSTGDPPQAAIRKVR